MTRQNMLLRKALVDYVQARLDNKPADAKEIKDAAQKESECVTLLVKKYNIQGALSKHMHECKISDPYVIEGPIVRVFSQKQSDF